MHVMAIHPKQRITVLAPHNFVCDPKLIDQGLGFSHAEGRRRVRWNGSQYSKANRTNVSLPSDNQGEKAYVPSIFEREPPPVSSIDRIGRRRSRRSRQCARRIARAGG